MTQKSTKMESTTKPKKQKPHKHLNEEEKLEVVKLHYLEGESKASLSRRFDVDFKSISRILRTFAAENDKSALFMKKDAKTSESEEIKALRKENLELRKKLYDETMRADFFETMVDVSEEMFGIEIRKKAGTVQSKGCTKTK